MDLQCAPQLEYVPRDMVTKKRGRYKYAVDPLAGAVRRLQNRPDRIGSKVVTLSAWYPISGEVFAMMRVRLRYALLPFLLTTQSCALFVEAAELEVGMAEASMIGARVGAARAALAGAELRAVSLEVPFAASRVPRALAAAAEAGAALTLTAESRLVARGRSWGRVSRTGDLLMFEASGAERWVGKVFDGRVWAPDRGGNLLPVAELMGELKVASYQLREASGSTTIGAVLQRGVPLEVIRVEHGWYQVRIRGTRTIGWIEAAALAVGVQGGGGLNTVASAVLSCARYDSLEGRGRPEHRHKTEVSPYDRLRDGEVATRRILLRYPPDRSATAVHLEQVLQSAGAEVLRQPVSAEATRHCGNEIYYHRDDLRTARQVQGLLAEGGPLLRISSFEVDEQRILVWLK